MLVISATDLARRTREVLDKVVIQGATVVVERNQKVIARIAPAVPHMNASTALSGLDGGLSREEAKAWLEDSRGNFNETVRDPWA